MYAKHFLDQTKDIVKNEQRMTSVLMTQHLYIASEIRNFAYFLRQQIMVEGKTLKIKLWV